VPARRLLVLACLLTASVSVAPAVARLPDRAERAVDEVSEDALRAWVTTLASDAFAGREVGHQGNRSAETFIAAALQDAHVPPGAANGSYFEPIELYQPALDASARLTVLDTRADQVADLRVGPDFYPLPETGDTTVTARVVDAGYGITVPTSRYDDYARMDARGAIVLVREGAPDKVALADRAPEDDHLAVSSIDRKIADARRHGARGVLVVRDYLPQPGTVWPEHPSIRAASYRLISDLRAQPAPVAVVSAKAAEPLRRALASHRELTATLAPGLAVQVLTVHNVLGSVEGRDAQRRREIVVIGAHLDHDGIDADGHIYNGADDNASGTAAVIAAAAAFARAAASGERPARTVVFALWNGEEKGELGAHGFLEDPGPRERVIANINLDMVGRHEEVPDENDWRFRGLKKVTAEASANTLHLLGYSVSPDLAAEVEDANTRIGLTLLEDYDHGAQNLLQRSDNWPFVEHGIPAVFLTTGLHPDYHTPDDDTARIDFAKLQRVARLAARAAWIVADGPAPTLKKIAW